MSTVLQICVREPARMRISDTRTLVGEDHEHRTAVGLSDPKHSSVTHFNSLISAVHSGIGEFNLNNT